MDGEDNATPTEESQVAKPKCLNSQQNPALGQSASVSSSNTTLSGEEGDALPLVASALVEVCPPQLGNTQIICTDGKVSDLESAKCYDEILTVESSSCENECTMGIMRSEAASLQPPCPPDDSPVTKEEEEEIMNIVREHDRFDFN